MAASSFSEDPTANAMTPRLRTNGLCPLFFSDFPVGVSHWRCSRRVRQTSTSLRNSKCLLSHKIQRSNFIWLQEDEAKRDLLKQNNNNKKTMKSNVRDTQLQCDPLYKQVGVILVVVFLSTALAIVDDDSIWFQPKSPIRKKTTAETVAEEGPQRAAKLRKRADNK